MRLLALILALTSVAMPAAAQELSGFDRDLTEAEQALKQGRLTPQEFRAAAAKLRIDLQSAYERAAPSQANTTSYAALLRRLGEPDGALKALNGMLTQDPGNANLRLTVGQSLFEKQDFAGALSQAENVLKRDPQNREALALKYQSLGRGATAQVKPAAAAAAPRPIPAPSSASAADSPVQKPVQAPQSNLQLDARVRLSNPLPQNTAPVDSIQEARTALARGPTGKEVADFLTREGIAIRRVPPLKSGALAEYSPGDRAILIPPTFDSQPLIVRAVILGHEGYHAIQIQRDRLANTIALELDAGLRHRVIYHELIRAGVPQASPNSLSADYRELLKAHQKGTPAAIQKSIRKNYRDRVEKDRKNYVEGYPRLLQPLRARYFDQVVRLRKYRNRMTSQEQLDISSSRVNPEGLALAEKKHFEETKWFVSWSAVP